MCCGFIEYLQKNHHHMMTNDRIFWNKQMNISHIHLPYPTNCLGHVSAFSWEKKIFF